MSIDYPYPQVHMVDWMEGVEWERERIIKLLKDDQTNCFCDDCYTNRATEVPFEVKHNEYLIALIKGEK